MRTAKNTTDEDRVRLATRKGSRMHGPTEYQRCDDHPQKWVGYRWMWDADSDPTSGDCDIVVECSHQDHRVDYYGSHY